jgi:hypothetical protein
MACDEQPTNVNTRNERAKTNTRIPYSIEQARGWWYVQKALKVWTTQPMDV